jgi:alcohol dehydrogenase YqhD (iron-dependent ADH family)
MWGSSLAHNGLTGCGRENFLAVHQLEHALSGEFDSVAHGAGLAVLFPAWAKFVYKEKPSRFAQFARRVFDVVDDNDLIAAEKGIEKMSEFFKEIGMPTSLREFGIEKDKLDRLADLCSYGKTRTVKTYITLDYQKMKEIFELCY